MELLLLVVSVRASAALDPSKAITQYVHDVWRQENGLPHNTIQQILQTPDGYIWMATLGGLVRFDGVRFSVFTPENTPALLNTRVLALAADARGNVWIGSEGGSLLRMSHGTFVPVGPSTNAPPPAVYALIYSRDGSVWVGTYGNGLYRYRGRYFERYSTDQGLPNNVVLSIYEDRDANIWVGTDGGGLSRLKNGRFTTWDHGDGLSNDFVYAICEDKAGDLWVGTYGGGLNRFRNGAFTVYRERDGLPSDFVSALMTDGAGSLWIGTYGGGLGRLQGGRFSKYAKREGLSNNIVVSLCEDRDGGLWVGTRGGLDRFSAGSFTCLSTAEGLADEVVLCLLEAQDRALWVGTRSGLNMIKHGAVRTYTTRNGLGNNTVTSLCEAPDASIWIGTSGGGLSVFAGERLSTYTTRDGLPNDIIWVVCADELGRIWAGTPTGLGRFDHGRWRTLTTRQGLVNDRVMALLEDRRGNLWVGTDGGGVSCLQKDGRFAAYTTKEGLSSDFICSFYEDREGTLWIGTWGGGLCRLRDGKLTAFPSKIGFANDIVHQILEDEDGNLWIRGNQDIFRVSKRELDEVAAGRRERITATVFGREHGIRSGESDDAAYQPAAIRASDGTLWFVTIEGLVSVDPRGIVSHATPPDVHIEGILADNVSLSIEPGAVVPVAAGTRRLEFRYTGVDFTAATKIHFRFAIDGFDNSWVEGGTSRSASYTHLPPGGYTFRVIAATGAGTWSRHGASLRFRVLPRFYQTTWFYALCAIAFIVAGPAAHLLRVRHLRARQRELAARVDAAVSHIKILRGLLPICASCKKIRDDAGYWNQIEVYIRDRSEAEFSHGMCPDCMSKLYPGLSKADPLDGR